MQRFKSSKSLQSREGSKIKQKPRLALKNLPLKIPKPLALIILDGWGITNRKEGNAILAAKTPNIDYFMENFPYVTLGASGESVGLPNGQMGNSEVGHLNLGAGRIVYQEFTRISKSIKEGDFFKNNILIEAIKKAKERKGNLHLIGLLSDGGVHSHNTHLYALLELAKRKKVEKVFIHAFLDGRDTPPRSALTYLSELKEKINQIGLGEVSTISGRYYSMDRDKRWERTKLAYDAMVYGQGEKAETPEEAVRNAYQRGENDEFVKPTVIKGGEKREQGAGNREQFIKDSDSVIFFNFRPDRARQITRSFIEKDFKEFDRGRNPPQVYFTSLTEYDATFKIPVAFPPLRLINILADVLAENGLSQLRIAETEKYAHVTFFFSGGEEVLREGETRILIPSPKVPTYDLKPEMSAYEVTERVLQEIEKGKFDVIILNYANPDMVGHTGVFEAAVKAAQTVDKCLGKLVQKIWEVGGECLITADHGNLEQMIDYNKANKPHTAHTCNPVPFIYIGRERKKLRQGGVLADVAPTILDLLNLTQPAEMTGVSLFKNESRRSK